MLWFSLGDLGFVLFAHVTIDARFLSRVKSFSTREASRCFGGCVEEGRIDLDFVGRLEAVEDDLARLVKLADLNPVGPLTRVNTSKRRRDWRSYYDDETAAIVETAYAADIRLLGYAFDPE